ncbi:hypothetical protein GCM10023331_12160 [Algivirga pacifica]|uniref:DUF4349 domain-containing protein n=2 Tax=Algivirga pacifica TaxID=1162670 RepID=A0ABP9D4Z8_9BACT
MMLAYMLSGCGDREGMRFGEKSAHKVGSGMRMSEDVAYEAPSSAALMQTESSINPSKSSADYAKKLVKTAYLEYKVGELDVEKQRLDSLLREVKGYVANETERKEYQRYTMRMTLKVPSRSFEEFIARLEKGAGRFDQKTINTEDISMQYYDLDARLKTKKALETRYLEILRKAKSVEDILKVEQNLSMVREEIEAAQSRLQLMDHQVGYSKIEVLLYKPIALVEQQPERKSFGERLKAAMSEGWYVFQGFLLFVLGGWAFWLVAIPVIYVLRLWWKKRKKK